MADIIALPPRVADPVEVTTSTGETFTVYTSVGYVCVDCLDAGDVPPRVIGAILSTPQSRRLGRILQSSADEADILAGTPLPPVRSPTPPHGSRLSWRIVAAQIALLVAAFALVIAGATLIGMAPLLVPITLGLGWSMIAAGGVSFVAAFAF